MYFSRAHIIKTFKWCKGLRRKLRTSTQIPRAYQQRTNLSAHKLPAFPYCRSRSTSRVPGADMLEISHSGLGDWRRTRFAMHDRRYVHDSRATEFVTAAFG